MQHILRCMEVSDRGVRAAAARCVLALSRSISNLRSGVMESGVVAVLCRRMSEDTCSQVQVRTHSIFTTFVMCPDTTLLITVFKGCFSKLSPYI
jgi:hypothetical protein